MTLVLWAPVWWWMVSGCNCGGRWWLALMIIGQRIETSQEKDPKRIPWSKNCAEYIIEATGIFTTTERACVSFAFFF